MKKKTKITLLVVIVFAFLCISSLIVGGATWYFRSDILAWAHAPVVENRPNIQESVQQDEYVAVVETSAWFEIYTPQILIAEEDIPYYEPSLPGYTGGGTRVENGKIIFSPPNNIYGTIGNLESEDLLNVGLGMMQRREVRLGIPNCSNSEITQPGAMPVSALVNMTFGDDVDTSQIIVTAAEMSALLDLYGIQYPTNQEFDLLSSEESVMTLVGLKWANRKIRFCYFSQYDVLIFGDVQGLFSDFMDIEAAILREAEEFGVTLGSFQEYLRPPPDDPFVNPPQDA